MRGESEKIWEFWAKSEKNKGNLSYCTLIPQHYNLTLFISS